MRRPLGVSVIAFCFLLAGIYLCSVAAMMLILPGAATAIKPALFVTGLKLVSPYWTLCVGTAWALVAWGLLRLKDWARWTAQLVLGAGIVWAVPMIYVTKMHFGWRLAAVCLQLVLRGAAMVYLFRFSVMDAFQTNRHS